MSSAWSKVSLESLGVLRVRGADAVPFLQGQLSGDVTQLDEARSLLAGYHNPQGRVIALLRLLQSGPQELLAVLPRELATAVTARLAKFILRARVTVSDASSQWQVAGLTTPQAMPAPSPASALPDRLHGVARHERSLAVCIAGQPGRWLLLEESAAGAAAAVPEPAAMSAAAVHWERAAIAAGEPEVYAATSEEFVAQMLNLDVLGAIAFDKGCYTGQEVIARAHYRGRVKRRLQRFITRTAARLAPGDGGELADGRSYKVVRSVPLADGRCEFLAVAPLTADAAAEQLPLPYPLPQ